MPPSAYLMGAVQMTSTADRARNVETALRLVNEAADLGAKLVALPENFSYMGPEEGRLASAETLEGPTLGALGEVAKRRGLFIVAGSIPETSTNPRMTANTSAVIADDGSVVAAYRKIHLFDVNIPDGARYAESEVVVPGDKVVLAPT
ncbi:MAG TPA: nitrilase-related carbon-nitrogen hydrolase, partial [Anaeromyxobacter sp.]